MKVIIFLIFGFNLYLSAWWLLDGNLLFHNDIARDFYLMKDIWANRHLTLIGSRAGGLTGWFHGPLWLYLNLPAFIFGHGNPIIIGWFWLLLHLLTCFIVFVVAKKIFNYKIAIYSLLAYSTFTILDVHGYLNPQGALIVFPIFFYQYWKYKLNHSSINLVISIFLIGLMIQFQIAFGAPILILVFLDSIISTFKDRQYSRLLSFLILLLPLSTYIVFEARHDFLQIRSLFNFATNSNAPSLIDKLAAIPLWIIPGIVLIATRKSNYPAKLFLYFYLGFWIITLFFNGHVMSYYHYPFLPMIIIIAASIFGISSLSVFLVFIILLLSLNNVLVDNQKYSESSGLREWSSWKSVKSSANWVIENCGRDSGYFVYTPDLYGYNLKYALDYQSSQKNITLFPYQKKRITCLVIAPNVKENPSGSDNWKSGDLKIIGKPVTIQKYQNGISVEKYLLTDQEVAVPVNPNLIKDTFFR